jgi:hypothetical protein
MHTSQIQIHLKVETAEPLTFTQKGILRDRIFEVADRTVKAFNDKAERKAAAGRLSREALMHSE